MFGDKILVGFYDSIITIIVLAIITIVIKVVIKVRGKQFVYITHEGIRASRYMDGLKLYISMAEKDRLELLQSVEGADTTPEGIVKLYEKLLPYATLFGIEDSWIEQLSIYCRTNAVSMDIVNTNRVIFDHDFVRIVHSASNYTISSTTRHYNSNSYSSSSSSGGSSGSSSSSGGGGGGFSGGGGGGGGGHGR